MNITLFNSQNRNYKKRYDTLKMNARTFNLTLTIVPILQTCIVIACIIHIIHFLSDPTKIHNYQTPNQHKLN